ncbi:MAG: hypothetical protein L0332_24505 [Chloroflexi bacterium]|nr:hypothetical protein [Chloroflexota bacterium]MCI0579867.1 hypothetical protein [Chloroflexota bacterium]MCI0646148.1 hypothetical protein [Chloroflexota bacterium]MCI0729858.1 hypothetical protein [Chloroflexota bacterium]
MDGQEASPSPALLAAQRRLDQLRVDRRSRPAADQDKPPQPTPSGGRMTSPATATEQPAVADPWSTLPDHLGWGSASLTAAMRAARPRRPQAGAEGERGRQGAKEPWGQGESFEPELSTLDTTTQLHNYTTTSIRLYPDLTLAMLRRKQAAAGRLWLLLRHLDRDGQGWLHIAAIREKLCDPQAPLRLCGWRQLRNLIRQGEGIFWQPDKERLWLKSTARVAAALGVTRLSLRPVAVPVAALVGTIGQVRAHFYATFHSGRGREQRGRRAGGNGRGRAMPVARATLQRVSGVSRRSQQAYERRAAVKVQFNYAVGEVATPEESQARGWQHGRALFTIQDYRRRQRRQEKNYLAWQLPNSYSGVHDQQPKGAQKRLNRQLADLLTQGTTGNGRETRESQQRFYANAVLAVRSYNRSPGRDVYWPAQQLRRGRLWQVIAALPAGKK